MGSNKVLKVALGREESDEYKQNISKLSSKIRGKIGLFFTKLPQAQVSRRCISSSTYACTGETPRQASSSQLHTHLSAVANWS